MNTEVSRMHKLPEQNELILRLKEAYKNKGLTLNKLIDLMPEDSNKLGRSTVQRLFHGENSENKSYDYNTLIFLANLLLDVNEDDPLLVFKREVIDQLET
jgi:transcriptional regulator with XRE-family HTH domain